MPIALPARRADLKRFSRAIRSRSPRVVAMGSDYSLYNHIWWLTPRTKCSYNPNSHDPGGVMLQGPIGLSPAPRRRPVSPWTKQRTRVLRRRGITYNAVIGKIHRLGISDRSPYGGAPGRRYAANTRPADKPVHALRAAWWFR